MPPLRLLRPRSDALFMALSERGGFTLEMAVVATWGLVQVVSFVSLSNLKQSDPFCEIAMIAGCVLSFRLTIVAVLLIQQSVEIYKGAPHDASALFHAWKIHSMTQITCILFLLIATVAMFVMQALPSWLITILVPVGIVEWLQTLLAIMCCRFIRQRMAQELAASISSGSRAASQPEAALSIFNAQLVSSSFEECTKTTGASNDIMSGQETCVICLEDFQPATQVCYPPCRHFFHTKCLEEWTTTCKETISCPMRCKDGSVDVMTAHAV